jgi:hypothetical protein
LESAAEQLKTVWILSKRRIHIIALLLLSVSVYAQNDDLYDHGLDEKKWNEIRDAIRYENQPEGAGREWTYESRDDYESAKRGQRNGSGNGTGSGSSGNGGAYRPDERSRPDFDPPKTKSPNFSVGGLGPLGYVLLGIFIILLAFLIYYLFVNREKTGKHLSPLIIEDTAPSEIPLTELQRLLQEALSKGDYRGAIRIYFIFVLRDLSEKNWIRWEKEKTNFQYLREMSGRNEYNAFNQTVSYFEIIWYGKREIDKHSFEKIKPHFTQLLDKLGVK